MVLQLLQTTTTLGGPLYGPPGAQRIQMLLLQDLMTLRDDLVTLLEVLRQRTC